MKQKEQTMSSHMKIGELASVTGVSRDTIRYYEALKLLPRASRTLAGYRLYTEADVERMRFIKQAQTLGLSLDEIRGLLSAREGGVAECQRVRGLLCSKLEELDTRIAEMRDFRRTLAAYLKECEERIAGKRGDGCPALHEMSHPAHPELKVVSRARRKTAQQKILRK
jgi:DNA-binding transcriptional MerR regulator